MKIARHINCLYDQAFEDYLVDGDGKTLMLQFSGHYTEREIQWKLECLHEAQALFNASPENFVEGL